MSADLALELVRISAGAAAGLLAGRAHFAALRRSLGAGAPRAAFAAAALARIGLASLVLAATARLGAPALIAALAAFLAARALALRVPAGTA